MADDPKAPADAPPSEERRRFLTIATTAIGACAGGLALLPLASAVISPIGRRTVRLSTQAADVGAISEFAVDEPRRVVIRGTANDAWETDDRDLGAAWVTRHSDGRWTAFSAVCPHLGCAVDHSGQKGAQFFCPCHDSFFSIDGAAQKGPSPRGLDALPIRTSGERVLVEFHRYVLNKKQQVES